MKKYLLLLLIAAGVSGLKAGETWVFVTPDLVNYDSTRLVVLGQQLVQELGIQAGVAVVSVPRIAPQEKTADNLKKLCADHKAVFGISGNISQIDATVFIYVEKWDASGSIIFRDRVSVQVGEEYESLIKRLAKTLITQQLFVTTASTSTIIKKEGRSSLRKGGGFLLVGRAGFLYPMGNSFRVQKTEYDNNGNYISAFDEGSTFSMEGGFAFDVDLMIAEATMCIDGSRALSFTIAAEYPFGGSDISPYLGGEVGATLVNKSEYSVANDAALETDSDGISLGVRAGVFLFRNSSFKLMPELRLFTVINKDYDYGIRFTIGAMLF